MISSLNQWPRKPSHLYSRAKGAVGCGIALAGTWTNAERPPPFFRRRRLLPRPSDATDRNPASLISLRRFCSVLPLLGCHLETPVPDDRPIDSYVGLVDEDLYAPTCDLVVQDQCITVFVDYRKPAVADSTRGDLMNGIGQALGRFTKGVKNHVLRRRSVCEIDREAVDNDTRAPQSRERTAPFRCIARK